jgi:hypothetical protein
VRMRGTKLLTVVVTLLLIDGSGCRLVLVVVSGLVIRLSRDGIGARVGSGFSETGFAVLELVEGLAGEEKSEKIETGLGAWDNRAHPIKNDSTLPIVIQMRKANFNGFMMMFPF